MTIEIKYLYVVECTRTEEKKSEKYFCYKLCAVCACWMVVMQSKFKKKKENYFVSKIFVLNFIRTEYSIYSYIVNGVGKSFEEITFSGTFT